MHDPKLRETGVFATCGQEQERRNCDERDYPASPLLSLSLGVFHGGTVRFMDSDVLASALGARSRVTTLKLKDCDSNPHFLLVLK